jgi:hypothetical protein
MGEQVKTEAAASGSKATRWNPPLCRVGIRGGTGRGAGKHM